MARLLLYWGCMLRIKSHKRVVLLALTAVLFICTPSSQASLGGAGDSVLADAAALSARDLGVKQGPHFAVHEIQSGFATIREYVNSAGIVFGIAWDGMRHPDLTALLGSYHGEYQSAVGAQPRQHGRRIRSVKSGNVVVETWGHMRKLQGHAFDPSLLPAGVSAHELQ